MAKEKETLNVFGINQIEKYEFYKNTVKLRSLMLGAYPKSPHRVRTSLGREMINELSNIIKKLLILDMLDIYKKEEADKRISLEREVYAGYKLLFNDMNDAKGTTLFAEKEWENQFNLLCSGITMFEGVLKRDKEKFEELYSQG